MAKQQSRAMRFADAIQRISESKSDLEILREELDNWLNNMPENLQNSNKASQLEDAISELEDIISNLEDVESSDVMFPSMF